MARHFRRSYVRGSVRAAGVRGRTPAARLTSEPILFPAQLGSSRQIFAVFPDPLGLTQQGATVLEGDPGREEVQGFSKQLLFRLSRAFRQRAKAFTFGFRQGEWCAPHVEDPR